MADFSTFQRSTRNGILVSHGTEGATTGTEVATISTGALIIRKEATSLGTEAGFIDKEVSVLVQKPPLWVQNAFISIEAIMLLDILYCIQTV